jgi:hypothetical protein
LEISKIFSLSAAARLYLFLVSGGGLEIFKIFSVSAAAAVFFWEKSAAAAAQPIGLHLYLLCSSTSHVYITVLESYNGLFDLNLNFRKKNELDFKLKCRYCGSSVIT